MLGEINNGFNTDLMRVSQGHKRVFISSVGGEGELALDAARIIKEEKPAIMIVGMCLSSCAEFIVPAAAKYGTLEFYREPLIGYHHNIDIVKASFQAVGRTDFEACFGDLERKIHEFAEEVGIPAQAYRTQMNYLNINTRKISQILPCRQTTLMAFNRYWFPTSDQLKSVFHLKFTGSVCADDMSCMKRSLLLLAKDGEYFVIGDHRFKVSIDSNEIDLIDARQP